MSCLNEWSAHLHLYGIEIALALSRALLPLARLSTSYRQSVAISYRKDISSTVTKKRLHAINGMCLLLSSWKDVFTSRSEYEDCATCILNAMRFPNELRIQFYNSVIDASNSSCPLSRFYSQNKKNKQITTTTTSTLSKRLVPNFPSNGSSIPISARKVLFKSMYSRLERYFVETEDKENDENNVANVSLSLDPTRCFECISKSEIRERECIPTLLLACASTVSEKHRTRLETLCQGLGQQLLFRIHELLNLELSEKKSKKRKTMSLNTQTTFLGGLNGQSVLKTCPSELIDVSQRVRLCLPLHSATAVALFSTFKEESDDKTAGRTKTTTTKMAMTLLEQQIILERALLKKQNHKTRGKKNYYQKKEKKRNLNEMTNLDIDTDDFLKIPYGVALWIIERSVSSRNASCTPLLLTHALEVVSLNLTKISSSCSSDALRRLYRLVRVLSRTLGRDNT